MTDERPRLTEVRTPRGNRIRMVTREGTNDEALVHAVVDGDEYRLRTLPRLTGWALDIGAHIGSVGIALAIDNPDLRVLSIEPVAENADLIRQSVEKNGVSDRVTVVEGAFGTDRVMVDFQHADGVDAEHMRQSRWIGSVFREPWHSRIQADVRKVKRLTLSGLLRSHRIDRVTFCKTDCEGGEWAVFGDRRIGDLARIHGEWHDRTEDELLKSLTPTHDVTVLTSDGAIGSFEAVARRTPA